CTIACTTDLGCNDNVALTLDSCSGAGTCSAECVNTAFICSTNSDCTDSMAPVCLDGGTASAACIACSIDTDCDDAVALTIDTCGNAGTAAAACTNTTIACNTNTDCDDADALTIDTCTSPATISSACSSTAIDCNINADCDDADALTIDTCYSGGTVSSTCGHSTIVPPSTSYTVDTTWVLVNSPYIIEGQLNVAAGVTLTIEPGVEVHFNYPSTGTVYVDDYLTGDLGAINVSGTLTAVGTLASPITFMKSGDATGRTAGYCYWGGIHFGMGSAGSVQYANFDSACYPIIGYFTSPTVSNVAITNNGLDGNPASYYVYVKTSHGWQEATVEHFPYQYQDRMLNLSNYLPDADGEYKVRILQTGSYSAHIDSIGLRLDSDTLQPVSAYDLDGSRDVLYKLATGDNDVLNMQERTIEVSFAAPAGDYRNAMLLLNAREEMHAPGGRPYTFPNNGFNRSVDAARFYSYTMGGNTGALALDGMISSHDYLPQPAFSEFIRPDSGHPDGIVHGYMKDDGHYLYATLDFAPDNTYDGTEDYATLYVKVGNELKPFRVSVPEMNYGVVGFNYTGSVNYQHKIYEFYIPLSEIGSPAQGETISYMFDAYGTTASFNGAITMSYMGDVNLTDVSLTFDPAATALSMNWYGIYLYYANADTTTTLQNVSVSGSRNGVYISPSTTHTVNIDNLSVSDTAVGPGLYIYGSSTTLSLTNSSISGTGGSNYNLNLDYVGSATISGLSSINGYYGISANTVGSLSISGSEFLQNGYYGVDVYGVTTA
ncbi:right-handed parallel beta-helix repeat-containing protein, partial [bacterium]